MEITLCKTNNKRTLMYIYIIEMCLLPFIQKTFYIKVGIVPSYKCNQMSFRNAGVLFINRKTITNMASS